MGISEIKNALKEYGLNDKETTVYLATLKLGSSKVNEIAKEAKLIRETTYFVLGSLSGKGLVNHVIKQKVRFFEASSPKKFLSNLNEREEMIKSVLSEMLEIEKLVTEKPSVELFEGKEGLKTVVDDFVDTKKPIFAFSCTQSFIEKLTYYFPQYIERRAKAKIPIKVITEKTKLTVDMRAKDGVECREMRFVDKKYQFKNAIFLFGDKIAILDLEKNMVGIVIKSKDVYKTFKTIFDIAWETSQ